MVEYIVKANDKTLAEHPRVRIILFECTVLPPYSYEVQQKFGLPVYDVNAMVHFVASGVVHKPSQGYM